MSQVDLYVASVACDQVDVYVHLEKKVPKYHSRHIDIQSTVS
jgi:hypothetical protein